MRCPASNLGMCVLPAGHDGDHLVHVATSTLTQAAALLGVESGTLRRQVRLGKLKATKLGPIWTVEEAEVERYRRENRREKA